MGAIGSLLETEVDDWDFTFAVLLRGVFLGIKHGARAMIDLGRGGSMRAVANTSPGPPSSWRVTMPSS